MPEKSLSPDQKALIRLIYEASTRRLDAQLQIATANDQRSLVFATLSLAAAALVFDVLAVRSEYYATGTVIFLCISSGLSALSALPSKFHDGGISWAKVRPLVEENERAESVQIGLLRNMDEYTVSNERKANRQAHLYRLSVLFFFIAIIIAALGFGLP